MEEEKSWFCIYRVLEKILFEFIYLFIFGSIKVFFYVFYFKYCADVKNCESFKSFDFIYIWVQLMCALKAHINYSYLEIFYGKMKKL